MTAVDCGGGCDCGRDGVNLPTRLTKLGKEETLLRLLAFRALGGRLSTDESCQEIRLCGVHMLARAAQVEPWTGGALRRVVEEAYL